MEGNVVKAAWILGGSMIASVVLAGVGLFVGGTILSGTTWSHLDKFSQRAANAVLEAPKNTRVSLNASQQPVRVALDTSQPLRVGFDSNTPVKVGFENKLPMALRIENSMDDQKGERAPLVLKLNP